MNRNAIVFVLLMAAAAPLPAQSAPASGERRAEVLVLGLYHMSNPGHDIFSTRYLTCVRADRQRLSSHLARS